MESDSPEPSRSLWVAPDQSETATPEHETGREPAVHVADEQSHSVDLRRLVFLAQHALTRLGVPSHMQLWITCIDAERMATLNAEHLQASGSTDVLAFPIDTPAEATGDAPAMLGDVVICPEVAAGQAAAAGRPAQAEIDLLAVHGILHLLGYDHAEPEERAEMFGQTGRILETFTPPEDLPGSAAEPGSRVRASASEPAGGDPSVRASASEPVGGDPSVRASASEPVGGGHAEDLPGSAAEPGSAEDLK